MSLPKPDLDDRNFDQLVDEAKKLVPGYQTSWTDHNWSDPGITLIDLFAWLTEATLYRINLITDSHRLKYLKLLGIRPEPPLPARADLTFEPGGPPESGMGLHFDIHLEKGDQVYTEISNKKIYFELDRDLKIVNLKLIKVIVNVPDSGVFDRTDANEKTDLFYYPFGEAVQKNSVLYLGFDKYDKNAHQPDSVNFMCYLYEKDLGEAGKHDEEKDYEFTNSKLKWEYSGSKNGKENWMVIFPADETSGFKRSGRLIFDGLDSWSPANMLGEELYWLRCAVEESGFEYPPRIEAIWLNTVPAVHGRTVRDMGRWVSNGLPGQVLKLRERPVLDGTLKLSINDGFWKEVEDFDGSVPDDNHYLLDKENGEIKFGDGRYGRVPPEGSKINVIQYKIGGGTEGNINPGNRWMIESENKVYDGLCITNYRASTGGKNAETIKEATERFCEDLDIAYTAVTSEDFEKIARNTPGLRVAKAKAIPHYHPGTGRSPGGSVTVVVIPDTPLEFFKAPPEPSAGFLNAICRHLDKHRLLGTEIHVISPGYVKVDVRAAIVPLEGFSEEKLKSSVKNRLKRFLHPIKGGKDNKGWEIGRMVSRSEIFEVLETVEGVDCVTKLTLSGDKGSSPDDDGNLTIPPDTGTVYSGSIDISISKTAEGCRKKRNCYGEN